MNKIIMKIFKKRFEKIKREMRDYVESPMYQIDKFFDAVRNGLSEKEQQELKKTLLDEGNYYEDND